MKKPKKGKYPNKPTAGSTVAAKQHYLTRVSEIDSKYTKEINSYESDKKKGKALSDKIKKVKR